MAEKNDNRYTQPNRLSDVITLISVLAVHDDTFKTASGLESAIRRKPDSGFDNWIEFGKQHPEFFRLNDPKSMEGEHLALVIRSYLTEIVRPKDGKKTRIPLTVEQTQKLIDSAISLHDKELARSQRWSWLVPIVTALIVFVGTLISPIIAASLSKPTKAMSDKIDSIQQSIFKIETRLGVK